MIINSGSNSEAYDILRQIERHNMAAMVCLFVYHKYFFPLFSEQFSHANFLSYVFSFS